MRQFKTTADIKVPSKLIDQIIGQGRAVDIIKKAARQGRHVLMIGSPGVGKSMLAQAMAELMPAADLQDVLVYPNPNDENRPIVKRVQSHPSPDQIKKDPGLAALYAPLRMLQFGRAQSPPQPPPISDPAAPPPAPKDEDVGQGRLIMHAIRGRQNAPSTSKGPSTTLIFMLGFMAVLIFLFATGAFTNNSAWDKWFVLATILAFFALFLFWRFTNNLGRRMGLADIVGEPKLIVDNTGRRNAPFVDATGNKAGALLGDVKHDPLQSGGMGTPAHLRVESGAIHRANKGVLFIDEIASLKMRWQQELLTAMQEKKYSITGQSDMSSGALVKTEPVPCDFVLVAAGNLADIRGMHPAMRSRIRGSGYEVYMEDTMPDTPENEDLLVQFVAQEVAKDGHIPHFSHAAVLEIVSEARKRSGRKKKLTLNLRELGGLVRAAGDLARVENAPLVEVKHIQQARGLAATMEQQISTHYLENKKEYEVFSTKGYAVGKVNGLAVLGDGASGLVMPIVAEVTPAASRNEGKLIVTGKLGTIAKEAVENVSAIIKKHIGRDVSSYDVHVQFLQTYEGVEGDSASVSIALAMLSAMEGAPVRQDVAMTGSLTVRGDVLPIGGATAKTEAALASGITDVIVPKKNAEDIYLPKSVRSKVRIHPVSNLVDVLKVALKDGEKKRRIIAKMKGILEK